LTAEAAKMIRKIIRKKKPVGRPVKPILFPPYSIFLTLHFSLCVGCGLVQIAAQKREKLGTLLKLNVCGFCNRTKSA
jgi:hypothetical protein